MISLLEEFERKLEWERRFARGFAPVSRRIIGAFRASISDGTPYGPEDDAELIAAYLRRHYGAAGEYFAGTVDTGVEYSEVESVLLPLFAAHAGVTAGLIARTMASDADRARELAESSPDIAPLMGAARVHAVAAVVPRILSIRVAARVPTIATTETQYAAETAKATAVSVAAGPNSNLVYKTWQTVGDERVRGAHRDADGQTVTADDSFVVGGERLRYPRDTGLGATPGNVVNCRCSAWYDDATIRALRK